MRLVFDDKERALINLTPLTIKEIIIMKLLASVFFILFNTLIFAQTNTIQITVSDSLTNDKLEFANVYLKKAGIGSSTNINGVAFLSFKAEVLPDTIMVSYIGYHPKSIVFVASGSKQIQVALSSNQLNLKEVVVTAEKTLKPLQVLRKAIKATPNNYSTQDVILKSLFRETILESDKYIQLNEAFVDIHYTAYPQKKLDSKIWEDWFYDETYAFDFDGSYYHGPLLKDFNTKRDKMKVLASRVSEDWSSHNIRTTLLMHPLLLTAFDKIKYQYDFLNPKLFSKYNFKHLPLEYVNGATCYVIGFKPKPTRREFSTNQSKKNKSAIYVGKVYIEKGTFAVVKYEYNLAINKNYGFFQFRIPLSYQVEVNYSNHENTWFLSSITLEEKNNVGMDADKNAIIHIAKSELFFLDIEKENVQPFPDSTIWKSTRFSALRCYSEKDNYEYWLDHPLPKKYQLTAKVEKDLSETVSLEEQFKHHFSLQKEIPKPIAKKKPYVFEYHQTEVVDSLHWMALPKYEKEFKDYIAAENNYTKNLLLKDRKYQRKVFNKLNNFYTKDKDSSNVKIPVGSFFVKIDSLNHRIYSYQKEANSVLPVFDITTFRKTNLNTNITDVLANEAKKLVIVQYNKIGVFSDIVKVYPFGKNTVIKEIPNVYSVEWWSNHEIIYAQTNEKGRSHQLYFYDIKTGENTLLYHETDETFDIDLVKEKDVLFCTIQSKSENEYHLISAENQAIPKLKLVQKREKNIIYTIKIAQEWYMLTNKKAPNNQILSTSTRFPFHWKKEIGTTNKSHIYDFLVSDNYIVANMYEKGLPKLKYARKGQKEWINLPTSSEFVNFELIDVIPKSDSLLYSESAPNMPDQLVQYDLSTQRGKVINKSKINATRDLKFIETKQLWAKSKDGTKVPITIMRSRKNIKNHKGLILKVYGAYGAISMPDFSAQDMILLQHGYKIAYAHVRGGSLLGNSWYEAGKLMHKKKSFEDYIACAEYLIKKKITSPEYLIAYGNSAGGLTVGAAINEHPEYFKVAIMDHPYLDVLNTMMDENLPLTTDEYKEWGNPNDIAVYDYIKSYSPYQNIKKQAYPNILLIGSYQDFQTPIWQVVKSLSQLRANNTSDSEILLRVDMNSTHIGNTTGKEWIKSYAEMLSFINISLFKNEEN